jgi:dolichol kinase
VTFSWTGQVNNWFIIAVGAFVVYQIKRFPVLIGYLLAMAMLLIGYALVNRAGIFDYLPVINLFFVFVMLIEPMTSPLESLQGWLFGIIVAIAGFIFYFYLPRLDFAISGLLIGNLSNLFLRRLKKR